MNVRAITNSLKHLQNSHIIKEILESQNCSLENLMDHDLEFLQELKNRNTQLLEFFNFNQCSKVIRYIISNPDTNDLKKAHKYPFICNEIILSEIPDILNLFYQETELLDLLFSFLDSENHEILLYSYFTNAVGVLLKFNSYELLSYIHDQKDIGVKLPYYLYSSSVMDLIYRLLACEDSGNPAYISKLYEIVDLILGNILGKNEINEVFNEIRIINSGIILENLLNNHIEVFNWSEIQLQLSISPNIEEIIAISYDVDSENIKKNAAISILTALIENLDNKNTEDNIVSSEIPRMIEILCDSIEKYSEILIQESLMVGQHRLKLIKMINALVKLNFEIIKTSISESNILNNIFVSIIQDLFHKYPWNSLLHNAILELIDSILSNSDTFTLKSYLIHNTNLIERLISASKMPHQKIGYIGQVIRIGNILLKVVPDLGKNDPLCEKFVNDFLNEKNNLENSNLCEGMVTVKSDLELPEIEEVFYDAIEYINEEPSEHSVVGNDKEKAKKHLEKPKVCIDEIGDFEVFYETENLEINDKISEDLQRIENKEKEHEKEEKIEFEENIIPVENPPLFQITNSQISNTKSL